MEGQHVPREERDRNAAQSKGVFDPGLSRQAAVDAFRKLDPREMVGNPVMFVVADVKKLVRRGSRVARRMNTDWFVVYVETPREAPDKIPGAAQR